METWQRVPLGELTASRPICYGVLKPGERQSSGIPLLRITDLAGDHVDEENLYLITPELSAEFKRSVLSGGEVLLSIQGTIGRVAICPPQLMGANISRTLALIAPDERIDRQFLRYWLLSMNGNFPSGGATRDSLNIGALRELAAPVPPKSEQLRIVAILNEAFGSISEAITNAEKNRLNARELFDSTLHALIVTKRAGSTPKTLREVSVDFGRGKSKHRPRNDAKLYGGPYPFIQTGDVRGAEHLITEYTQTYSDAGLAQSKLWPKGTLCITIAANIAETGVLGFDACFPDSVIGVVVDASQTSSKYLEYMLHTVKADLKAKGKGSAQDNINLATFENERFPFPGLDVQARIVSQLDDLSSEVQRLEGVYESKLAALDELKKSLLHQAFSGQL